MSPARLTPRPGETVLPAAAEMAGISYRTIDYWVRQGYLHVRTNPGPLTSPTADYPGAPGSGRPRYLEPRELYVLLQMARLVHAGLVPAVANDLARKLGTDPPTQSVTLGPGIVLIIRPVNTP